MVLTFCIYIVYWHWQFLYQFDKGSIYIVYWHSAPAAGATCWWGGGIGRGGRKCAEEGLKNLSRPSFGGDSSSCNLFLVTKDKVLRSLTCPKFGVFVVTTDATRCCENCFKTKGKGTLCPWPSSIFPILPFCLPLVVLPFSPPPHTQLQ